MLFRETFTILKLKSSHKTTAARALVGGWRRGRHVWVAGAAAGRPHAAGGGGGGGRPTTRCGRRRRLAHRAGELPAPTLDSLLRGPGDRRGTRGRVQGSARDCIRRDGDGSRLCAVLPGSPAFVTVKPCVASCRVLEDTSLDSPIGPCIILLIRTMVLKL